jgi:hypothetical protein
MKPTTVYLVQGSIDLDPADDYEMSDSISSWDVRLYREEDDAKMFIGVLNRVQKEVCDELEALRPPTFVQAGRDESPSAKFGTAEEMREARLKWDAALKENNRRHDEFVDQQKRIVTRIQDLDPDNAGFEARYTITPILLY